MTISKSSFIVISTVMITILILFQFSNISANYASKSMQNPNAESEVSISSRQALLDNALDMPEELQYGYYRQSTQSGGKHCRGMVSLHQTYLPPLYEPSGILRGLFQILHSAYCEFHFCMYKKGYRNFMPPV